MFWHSKAISTQGIILKLKASFSVLKCPVIFQLLAGPKHESCFLKTYERSALSLLHRSHLSSTFGYICESLDLV